MGAEQAIVYGSILVVGSLALLGAYIWATRADKRTKYIDDDMHPGVIFGDASLLDHPATKPTPKRERREPEPTGA